jgi:hypothetical protein
MNYLQGRLALQALKIEIDTWDKPYRMQLTSEPAMKIIGRLMKIDAYAIFGKGLKGRINAYKWLEHEVELKTPYQD